MVEFGRKNASPEFFGVVDGKGSSRRLARGASPCDGWIAWRVENPEQLADKGDHLWERAHRHIMGGRGMLRLRREGNGRIKNLGEMMSNNFIVHCS